MKRPLKVKVGAHTYRISYVETKGACSGLCHTHAKTIHIRQGLEGRYLAETLLHEVMHAIWYEWGITNSEMPEPLYRASVATEESAINGLANGLMAVMRDNPPLRRFITERMR